MRVRLTCALSPQKLLTSAAAVPVPHSRGMVGAVLALVAVTVAEVFGRNDAQ